MAEKSEAVSRTTFGGCTLDDLHRGSKNYVCDASCLVNLVGKDRNEAKEGLKHKVDEIFRDLELQTERKVKKYYIGKTFIKQRRRPNNRKKFVKFDPMDPYTWKKNGISNRWRCHKNLEYGRNGLVVLTAVTKDAVPQQCRSEVHQEQYALALEQMLLHHYKLDIGDQRLHNDTFTSGGPDGGKSIAYAVYVAFTLEEQTEENDFENGPMSTETGQLIEEQTTSGVLSSQLEIEAQETSLDTPLTINTSTLSVLNQPLEEQTSLSDNDAFVIKSPQLDKIKSHQATNCIPSLQTTKPIHEQISLRENNALVIDFVNSHQLDLKKVTDPQLHYYTTLQCPPSLQLKFLTMLQSVRNQLLLERISCHPIVKTKNVATSLNTTCATNAHERLAIVSPKKVQHKETQLHTSFGERSVNRQTHFNLFLPGHTYQLIIVFSFIF